jgi:Uma2 family endonuclease
MATGTLIPVEEYLRTSYEPDMEYVDGQLVERSVGERRHSRIQTLLAIELGSREHERGFEVFTEQRIVIQPRRRYRVPDICVKAVPYDPVPVFGFGVPRSYHRGPFAGRHTNRSSGEMRRILPRRNSG